MRLDIKIIVLFFLIILVIVHIKKNSNDDNSNRNSDIHSSVHRRMFEGTEPFQYNQYHSIRSYISRFATTFIRRRLTKELVKASGKAIYVVDDGILHWIPDWDTFIAYGFDLHNVKYIRYNIFIIITTIIIIIIISDEQLASYPVGEPLDAAFEEMTAHKRTKCPCETSNIPDDASSILNATKTPSLIAKRITCLVDNTNAKLFLKKYDNTNLNINIKLIDEAYANDIIRNSTITLSSGNILMLLHSNTNTNTIPDKSLYLILRQVLHIKLRRNVMFYLSL